MEKISSQKVAAVLSTVPNMLRGLAAERDELVEKNASLQARIDDLERQNRVNQLAKTAADKGIESWGESHEEKVASIETAIEQGKSLDVMEEAIKMASPNGELGELSGDELEAGNAKSELEAFLVGHLG